MTRPPSPRGGSWPSPGTGAAGLPGTERAGWPSARDDEWGPATAVYSSAATSSAGAAPGGRSQRPFYPSGKGVPEPATNDESGWAPAGPQGARDQRAVRAADRRTARSVEALENRQTAPERGLSWWLALALLIGIAALGGVIDTVGSIQLKSGFNIGIVVASIAAVIVVKRSHMFPVVIAPPIVYSVAALFEFYVRRSTASSGMSKRQIFFDAAANYFVYGFPAIAAATAAVLIIAGVRLIARK